jgi:hypothetical protein
MGYIISPTIFVQMHHTACTISISEHLSNPSEL